jgi:RimJ/RimL family protein N-acetyltransferase
METVDTFVTSAETVRLSDGVEVTFRPIAPHDAAALVRFHARLSRRAVTMRYFYPHLVLRAEEVEHFTNVDGKDRVALVVERANELVAVGRFDRLNDPTLAEVAFVVADEFQHRGIATLLLARLADRARDNGIREFMAEVLAENAPMLSVFHAAGFSVKSKCEWGTIELKMRIVPAGSVVAEVQIGALQRTRVPPPSID